MKLNLHQRLPETPPVTSGLLGRIAAALIVGVLLAPQMSWAQTTTFDLPVVTQIGCALVEWMTGPLAVVIFLIVTIGTLVVGIFAKMDWTKILTVIIIFGIIQGLVAGSFKLGVAKNPQTCQNIKVFQ
jgi:type IV secretory pathway VirB2 component (pilin)